MPCSFKMYPSGTEIFLFISIFFPFLPFLFFVYTSIVNKRKCKDDVLIIIWKLHSKLSFRHELFYSFYSLFDDAGVKNKELII